MPQCSLLVDPLLAPHSEAFSGALFQCHLVQGASGATAVVAAGGRCVGGGLKARPRQSAAKPSFPLRACSHAAPTHPHSCRRYDSLLKASWARQSALSGTVASMPPLHAVGVTLNADRLVAVAQGSSRWSTPGSPAPGEPSAWRLADCKGAEVFISVLATSQPAPPPSPPAVAGLPRLSQADVLVCSRGGGGLLKERMALARSLWDAGLAAEMLPQAAPSLTEQYEYAQSRGIPWLVIINANTFEGGCPPAAAAAAAAAADLGTWTVVVAA